MSSSSKHVTEVIRSRRTVKPKAMSDKPVHKSHIEEMLQNANWAPTHGMTEPWRFRVFTGDGRDRLAEFLAKTYKEVTTEDTFRQNKYEGCLLYTSPSPRDLSTSRMPSSA